MASDNQIRDAERAAYQEVGSSPRERTITVADGDQTLDVRLLEIGADDASTPVVMLHGVASASILFAPLLPALTDRRVVIVDWPGHGLSGTTRVEPGNGLRRHARTVLAAVLDALEAEQVDLVGHSLGAQFALYTAVDQPERVRRVVTLGAPGAGLEGVKPIFAMKLMAVPVLGALLLRLPTSESQFRKNTAMALGAGVLERQSARLRRAARLVSSRTSNAPGIASMFRALLKGGRVRHGVALSLDELRTIAVPVLMFWGDRDVFMTPDQAEASIQAIPSSTLVRMDAGHAPWLELPGQVAVGISRFFSDEFRTVEG